MTTKQSIESIKTTLNKLLSLTKGNLPQSYTAAGLMLFVIIRRLECLFEPYRQKVLTIYNRDKNKLDEQDMGAKMMSALNGELDYYLLTPYTMQDLLMQGYFTSAAGMEHYIRSFDPKTADQLLKYGVLDYTNRLIYSRSFAQFLSEICALPIDASMPREEFEELVSWLLQLSHNGGIYNSEFYSTNELSQIMATVLLAEGKQEKHASVYDPVCGSGNLLRTTQSRFCQPMSVFGQEIVEKMVSLNGLLAKASSVRDCNFVSGDVLEEDKFIDKQFDFVVADIPIRMRFEDRQLFWDDNRFPLGKPSTNDATGLFIQHIISKMAPKGRAVFTCLPSLFFEEKIYSNSLRSWMLEQDIIESIIALPAGFVPGVALKICLCVLNKNKPEHRKDTIQIINAESLFPRQKNRGAVLTDKSLELLVSVYRSFENNEYCRIARLDDFYQYVVDVKQPQRNNDGSLILVDGKKVADRRKTVCVTIPNGEHLWEDYVYSNVINHLDKDSWIDQTTLRAKCKIDIGAPFEKVTESRSAHDIEKDVILLRSNVFTLFEDLLAENKKDEPICSSDDFSPKQALLGSIVRIIRYRNPLVKSSKKGKYPVLSPDYLRGFSSEPSEYVDSLTDEQIVDEGDVLMILDGENAGEVFRGKKGVLSRTMAKVESTTSIIDRNYLYYMLKAKEPALRLKAREGTTLKHLAASDLHSLQITIPAFSCQLALVRSLQPKIDALDKLIPLFGDNTRIVLLEYRQALIQDAITSVTSIS